jgi:hypothetical protein
MISNWATDCARCGTRIEEGDDIFFATGHLGVREKICWTCASMDGLVCSICGEGKKQDRDYCYQCQRDYDVAEGFVCECGKYKKPQYAMCWTCKTEGATE